MSEIDRVARELVLLFRSLRGLHRSVLDEVGVRAGMPAFALLTALDEIGGQRLSTLADALHLELSTASRQVAALEREGWVRRQRDPRDSRAALLELTPDGRRVLARVRATRVERLARLVPDWSPHELRDFADQLQRLRCALATDPDPATTRSARAQDRTPALTGQEQA